MKANKTKKKLSDMPLAFRAEEALKKLLLKSLPIIVIPGSRLLFGVMERPS